jgi:hypothetical protein
VVEEDRHTVMVLRYVVCNRSLSMYIRRVSLNMVKIGAIDTCVEREIYD